MPHASYLIYMLLRVEGMLGPLILSQVVGVEGFVHDHAAVVHPNE